MKKILFALLTLTIVSFVYQPAPNFNTINLKKDFAKVKPDFFVCKYEVSNLDYRTFLEGLKTSEGEAVYRLFLPDTLCWTSTVNETPNAAPFIKYYFRHQSYDNYPVVGISYDAAVKYCDWLTENYNKSENRKFSKAKFKLLTEEEWTFAANKGDTSKVYTWGSGYIQNNRHMDLCNYRKVDYENNSKDDKSTPVEMTQTQKIEERNKITAPVNSFFPNSFGIYNMCGNVAEMIANKGIAKGGGYNDPAYKVTIASEEKYSNPQCDIGFRVAMQVIDK